MFLHRFGYAVRATALVVLAVNWTAPASAQTSLVAAYSFNAGSGTTVADASGKGNTGTITSATWTTAGKYGGALSFNGTSARVTIPDAVSLRLTTGMTLEAWVNPSTISAAWRDVVYKGNDNYFLEATTPTSSRPAIGGTFVSTGAVVYGTAALTVNTWAHLAATYDGATLRLYVNGVQVSSSPRTGNLATSTNPLQIGGDSIYGQYFRGTIDEVRVYNVALTAAQIQADMNAAIGTATAPDLTLTKTHGGSFAQGQTGATYTIAVRNVGTASSSGVSTVVDTLPAGLSATAMSGSGWSCTLATLTCTRSDALAAGASYPAITLTVNVAGIAPPSLTNTATVTGGGQTNTANDTATDVTAVTQLPDLTLTKVHPGNFTQGQTAAAYTMTVRNSGAGATTGAVTVTDMLPGGLTVTAMSGGGWNCTLATLTCMRSDALAAGASYPAITLTVNVAGSAPPSVTNTATVAGGGQANTANDTATDVTAVTQLPDLTLTKTHAGDFEQGQTGVAYALTVRNVGTGAATGVVTVTDTLPAGLTATNMSGTGWSCTLAALSCTRTDALAAGASYPAITLAVNVAGSAPPSVTNTATVAGGGETNTANDTAADATTVIQFPDLTITKTHAGDFAQGQGGAGYTITVRNDGTGVTTGVVTVTDMLPSGLTATAIGGAGWSCTLATLTCTRSDSLAAGASYDRIDVIVNVAMTAPPGVVNTVTVYGGGETNTGNDTATDPTGVVQLPDLTVTQTHAGTFSQGQAGAMYTLTVRNAGSAPSTGVVTVTDTLPAGLSATAIAGEGWSCTLETVTCSRSDELGADASYAPIVLTVDIARDAPPSVANMVSLTGGGDINLSNNVATESATVSVVGPDLTITKTHAGSFTQGQTGATYNLVVSNDGTGDTSEVVTVIDALPGALTARGIEGAGWNCALATLTCTRNDALAAGARYAAITVTADVAIMAPAAITNTATVSGGGETNVSNDTAADPTAVIQLPDLTLTNTHVGSFAQGQTAATYTVIVANSGTGATSGMVTVIDTLPGWLTATGMAGNGWNCALATLTCARSDVLAPGTSYPAIVLTVNVAIAAPATVTNVATVSGGGEASPANNTASDVTPVTQLPDLTLTHTHTGEFTQGQTGAYALTVTNGGSAATTGAVTVTVQVAMGLTAANMSGTGWTCTLATVTCTRSDALAAGESYPVIALSVNVSTTAPALITNTATVSGGGETSISNNAATDPTTITQLPDLTLTKTHTGSFTRGQTGATYTITVRNGGTGPTRALVTVTDTLPGGLSATAMSGTGWTCTLPTLTCTRSDALEPGGTYAPIVLTVDVATDAPPSVINTASVDGGPETNSTNDSASDTTSLVPPPTPDLSLTKTHTGTFTQSQAGATYTLTARNVGTGPTSGTVTVTDTLPGGLTAMAINGPGWLCTLATLTCTRGDALAAGAAYPAIALTVSVAASAPPSVTNSASVGGGGESNTSNNTSMDVTPIATQSSGLVAAYAFNEGSGTTVLDASGNGNTGTVSGTTWTTGGKYGSALSFNGTSARVTIPDAASLRLTNAMTLEAWVRPSSVTSAWRDVVYKGDDNYYLEATSNTSSRPAAGGTLGTIYGTAALTVNTWAHLAVTYDRANIRLYVNGTQVSSAAATATIATSANPLQIGGDGIYGQFFKGLIDEVRVYNVALTASRIQADMNAAIVVAPDLTLTKSHTGSFLQGQTGVTYTVTARNSGIVPTNGTVTVTDTLPGSLTATSMSGTGWSCVLTTLTCTRADALAAGGSYPPVTLTVNVAPDAPASLANTASVSGGGETNTANDIATDVTTIIGFDISPHISVLTSTQTQAFSVSGAAGQVVWAVDGVVGGTVTSGTITPGGLYTPPPNGGSHTVAVISSDQLRSASASVYVTNYPGTFTRDVDNLRTGLNPNETVLTLANVNSTQFGKLFSYSIDGVSDASPLYVANVDIPGVGLRNVVYVATEHDSVYAFDADGRQTAPLWQVSFIDPAHGVTPVPPEDTGEPGDISPEIGITGTPVIDPATRTLYVVAKTKEVSGDITAYVHRLHALDLATGAEKFGGPRVIDASAPGTGDGSAGGVVPFISLHENQRAAMMLSGGVVYVAFAGHGDQPPYHGWVLGYRAGDLQQVLAFITTPNGEGGGVWQSGDGLATDATGNIYFVTGDGDFDANSGGSNFGDSFMKLSPSGAVVDYFTPHDQDVMDTSDIDLGSGGTTLLPDQPGPHPHLAISAGKNGSIYLVDRDNMGRFNPANDNQIVQTLVNTFPNGSFITGNFKAPVYWNSQLYFSADADNIKSFQVTNGLLSTSPTSRSPFVVSYPGATLSLSSNGNADGILWAIERIDLGPLGGGGTRRPGVLHAFDATNLGVELYSSDQAPGRDDLDYAAKWASPLIANGKVFIATNGRLTGFGLLPQ